MALWGFWNDRARDLDRLLSVMPDFDAARFDAGQLQQGYCRFHALWRLVLLSSRDIAPLLRKDGTANVRNGI